MDMRYCRKIFASHLRQSAGIESKIVDLLQGRVPRTVFARHYFTPSLDYRQKVLQASKIKEGHRAIKLYIHLCLSMLLYIYETL
jgi:intergrase/recombinase